MVVVWGWAEGEMGIEKLMGLEFQFYTTRRDFWDGWLWWLHKRMNVLKAIERYT